MWETRKTKAGRGGQESFNAASRRFHLGAVSKDLPHETVQEYMARGGQVVSCPAAGTAELRAEIRSRGPWKYAEGRK